MGAHSLSSLMAWDPRVSLFEDAMATARFDSLPLLHHIYHQTWTEWADGSVTGGKPVAVSLGRLTSGPVQ